ncbi:MAG: hypothetical protein MJZ30_10505 [Paludibacteraceae bacterium]|nr:hypothetical protein [Paludibacteraceae bacterium]
MDTIKEYLNEKLKELASSFNWLSIKYEFIPKFNTFCVSYNVPNKEKDNEDFYVQAMILEEDINSKFKDKSPLFCENERLFSLSDDAICINETMAKSFNFDFSELHFAFNEYKFENESFEFMNNSSDNHYALAA